MLKNNGNKISFPKRSQNGNIEFGGEKFEMTELIIEEEDI